MNDFDFFYFVAGAESLALLIRCCTAFATKTPTTTTKMLVPIDFNFSIFKIFFLSKFLLLFSNWHEPNHLINQMYKQKKYAHIIDIQRLSTGMVDFRLNTQQSYAFERRPCFEKKLLNVEVCFH